MKLIFIYCMMLLAIFLSACGQDKTITKTVIQTQYSTVSIPFLRYTTVYVPTPTTPIQNQIPTAIVGTDKTVNVWDSVILDGSGSNDPDHDFIGYSWIISSRPSGSTANLLNSNTATPSFVPDYVGDYVVTLIVTDGKSNSAPASLVINAQPYVITPTNTDPTGIITVTTSTFEYWYQDSTKTTVLIHFKVITNDGISHSFRADYAAVDALGNIIYASYLTGAAPEVFQTSAQIDNDKYLQISKWMITNITKY